MNLVDIFKYQYEAILVGLFISVSAVLVSPFLVLNKQSMIADGMSHASFLGFIIALLFMNEPIYIALIITAVFSVILRFIIRNTNIEGDSAIGIISSVAFSIGLIIISKKNFNVSVDSLIEGNLLAAKNFDVIVSGIVLTVTALFVTIYYRQLLSTTFDEEYTKFNKINGSLLGYIISILVSVLIVVSVRQVGALLTSSLIILPTTIATQFKKNFSKTLIISLLASISSFIIAFFISILFDLNPGPVIVVTEATILILSILFVKIKSSIVRKSKGQIKNLF
ncbi:hypothetical protein DLH72_03515 [Candidatus Gracilibacteria bacterium]|nr:MAG: hypothetical protein DLH72_03515 [Candidatus Gracilibacteria bacterium]